MNKKEESQKKREGDVLLLLVVDRQSPPCVMTSLVASYANPVCVLSVLLHVAPTTSLAGAAGGWGGMTGW